MKVGGQIYYGICNSNCYFGYGSVMALRQVTMITTDATVLAPGKPFCCQ